MPAPNATKDARALSFRAQGWTYDRIAAEMRYHDRSAARKAVERALGTDVRESNEAAKALLIADLNAAKQAVWAVLEANHLVISDGRVVTLDGEPIPDDEPVLKAVDRLVKIDQELAKIYGAYAPALARVEVITEDVVDAELAVLARQVADNDAAAAGSRPA